MKANLLMHLLAGLYVADTSRMGRGVFTSTPIAAGTFVEVAPVLVMEAAERILLDRTLLHDYLFEWGDGRDKVIVALGYVSIYNHACPSNCEYEMDYAGKSIAIKSVRNIAAGEELFINYNGDYDDLRAVWFEDLGGQYFS